MKTFAHEHSRGCGRLAHLIRDVKFLVEHPYKKNQAYGQLLLADLRRMFGVIHHPETERCRAG